MFRLSPEERANVEAQLDELTATYNQLCDSSNQQLQQLEQQLAKEEERKVDFLASSAALQVYQQTCVGPTNEGIFFFIINLQDAALISVIACQLSVTLSLGQQECVLHSMSCSQCVHFITKITTIDDSF